MEIALHHAVGGAAAAAQETEVLVLAPARALHAEVAEGLVERLAVAVEVDVRHDAVALDDDEERVVGRGGFHRGGAGGGDGDATRTR